MTFPPAAPSRFSPHRVRDILFGATFVLGVALVAPVHAAGGPGSGGSPGGSNPGRQHGRLVPVLPDGAPAQPSTDRAECTESAQVLEAGHKDWGIDVVSGSIDRLGPLHSSSLAGLGVEGRWGVGNGFELGVGTESWNRVAVEEGALRQPIEKSGFGATTLSARRSIRAGGDSLISSCVGVRLRVPGSAEGPGSRSAEGGVFLPVSFPLDDDTRVNAMVEGDVVSNAFDAGRHAEGVTSAEISHDFGDRVSARLEALGVWYGESRRPWLGSVNAGVSIDPFTHFGITLGVAAGHRGETSDLGGFGRLSVHP